MVSLSDNVPPFKPEHSVRNRKVHKFARAFLVIFFSRDETQHSNVQVPVVRMRISQMLQEGSNWAKIAFFQKICDKFSCQGYSFLYAVICLRYLVKASLSRNSTCCYVWEINHRSSFPSFFLSFNIFLSFSIFFSWRLNEIKINLAGTPHYLFTFATRDWRTWISRDHNNNVTSTNQRESPESSIVVV